MVLTDILYRAVSIERLAEDIRRAEAKIVLQNKIGNPDYERFIAPEIKIQKRILAERLAGA